MGTRKEAPRAGAAAAAKGGTALTRTDRIRQAIERAIVSGRLLPGTKLDENALAARHGASRTPVRQALQQLASQGFIELRANAGAFVATLTVVELAERFETLAYLEGACAALAARRHTAEDRRALSAAHDGCAKAALRDDHEAFYEANRRFHACIYAASHNGYLAAQTIQLASRLEPFRREATFHPGLMAMTMNEHDRIMHAIFGMNEADAGQQMRHHLDTLRDDAVSMARATQKGTA